eukprot:3763366-Prymnesium_polylepis.2
MTSHRGACPPRARAPSLSRAGLSSTAVRAPSPSLSRRDELLPMVGAWRSLVTDKERKEIVERTTRLWQAGQAGGAAVQARRGAR